MHVTSATGILTLSFDPSSASSNVTTTWIVVVLRHLTRESLPALMAGEFRNDVLRIPYTPTNNVQVVHVPIGRPLTILLASRDSEGQLVRSPSFELQDEEAEPSLTIEPPPPTPARPDLVFVEGGAPPNLETLARAVAKAARGESVVPRKPPHQGSFGTRQRWSLTRLGWNTSEHPLWLIARSTFIGPDDLEQWRTVLPADAIDMGIGCDSLIDATSEEGKVIFYAVLEQRENYRPVVLSPILPPYEASSKPYILGDAEARLAPTFEAIQKRLQHSVLTATDLSSQLDRWEAAVHHLEMSEFREEVLNWVKAMRSDTLF